MTVWTVKLYDEHDEQRGMYLFSDGDKARQFAEGFGALAADAPGWQGCGAYEQFDLVVDDPAAKLAELRAQFAPTETH